jgi:hypothetical protein
MFLDSRREDKMFWTEWYAYHKNITFVNPVIKDGNIGFEVVAPVSVKRISFWAVKLCISERALRFGEHIASLVYCLALY